MTDQREAGELSVRANEKRRAVAVRPIVIQVAVAEEAVPIDVRVLDLGEVVSV